MFDIAACEDVARIAAAARKAGVRGRDRLPYVLLMWQRLQAGLDDIHTLEALAVQWRDSAVQALQGALATVVEDLQAEHPRGEGP